MAAEAAARGYAAYIFDGPGQGETLYDRRIFMRPDWEEVLPPVVDALAARDDVDQGRIALIGRSFGGYLAPRAASGEHRIAALVTDPGQYDLGAGIAKRFPPELTDRIDEDSPEATEMFQGLLGVDRLKRLFGPRMATHGSKTVQEYFRTMRTYNNEGLAELIRCPTLVCDNETDQVSTGQGQLLFDHLECPKDFIRFTAAEGAEGHCEGMGGTLFLERAFDWLDEKLGA